MLCLRLLILSLGKFWIDENLMRNPTKINMTFFFVSQRIYVLVYFQNHFQNLWFLYFQCWILYILYLILHIPTYIHTPMRASPAHKHRWRWSIWLTLWQIRSAAVIHFLTGRFMFLNHLIRSTLLCRCHAWRPSLSDMSSLSAQLYTNVFSDALLKIISI